MSRLLENKFMQGNTEILISGVRKAKNRLSDKISLLCLVIFVSVYVINNKVIEKKTFFGLLSLNRFKLKLNFFSSFAFISVFFFYA